MKIRNINIENDELVVIKIEGDTMLKCLRKDDDNKLYVCNILTPAHKYEWDSSLGNIIVDYIKTEVTNTPDWNIPGAEYRLTPFED